MMLPIDYGWIQPGVRAVAKTSDGPGHRELIFLWPKSREEWITHTPDDRMVFERLASMDDLAKLTGGDSYPNYVQEIFKYEEPVENQELVELIQKGRKEARTARERDIQIFDDGSLAAVGWAGSLMVVAKPGPLALCDIGSLGRRRCPPYIMTYQLV